MTTGAITPKLVTLAWPLVAGNLLQTFYNLADMFWVGRVGPTAVAAVSLMFPTSWLFVSLGMGLTAGAVALVSQHVGADEDRAAETVVAQTMLLAVALGVVLAVVGYVGRVPFLTALGARGGVYADAMAYFRVMLLSIPFTFLFFSFRASLRAAGDTRTAMWLVVLSAGVNVALDPFLVLGWGPFPHLGTEGAAIATLFSRLLAAVAGVAVLLRGNRGIRLLLADLTPDPVVLRRLVAVGFPATLDGAARSVAAVAMVALVARFGPVATAAYGIGVRMMSVSWTVSGAVGQAAATGVGQNLGARTPDRAASVTWTATAGTMVLLFAAGAVVFAVPAPFMRVFIADADVVAAGVHLLRIIAPFWAFLGGLMVLQGAFRGAGQTTVSMALSVLSRWLLRLPVAFALAYALSWGTAGLWWSLSISGVLAFTVGVGWFRSGGWREGVLERPSARVGAAGGHPDADVDVDDDSGGDAATTDD